MRKVRESRDGLNFRAHDPHMGIGLVALLLLVSFPWELSAQVPGSGAPAPEHTRGFLTGPVPGDALGIAQNYIRQNRAALGLEHSDLEDWVLSDRTTSRHSGVTHINLRQRLSGIEVDGGTLHINVTSDGRLFGLHNRFVAGLAKAVNTRVPSLTAVEAAYAAALDLGLTVTQSITTQQSKGGPSREVLLGPGGISLDPIPVKLMFFTDGEGTVRLVWNLFIRPVDQQHWWNLNVDADSGAVLSKTDWILRDSYRAFPVPLENPDEGAHSLEVDPADTVASPFAWHDTNGATGAEFTDTRGNNVLAQEDTDANNTGGFRPTGGAGLAFDFPLNKTQPSASSQSAAITNLFHWNNILHDIHYQYGFDEESGNFQTNNYGKGGTGGDAVNADAQDGSGLNNANFSRAPEGSPPRMQMYRFQFSGVIIHSPAGIADTIAGGTAEFGTALSIAGSTRNVVQALDPADPVLLSTTDGCSTLTNPVDIAGNIALIDRGDCPFVQKVANAQAAGAAAALIVNNAGDEVLAMGGTDATITIPSMFIGQTHGNLIKSALATGVNVTLSSQVERDGDFDNGIIVHEYGHGVSVRLSGGPSNVGCLSLAQSAGMGEGWGDWWALALTAKLPDTGPDSRPIGSYALGEGANGPGIRNFPYSTDLAVNPQTLASINGTNQPHGVGEIWAQVLWEVYWNLRDAHGFDSDIYAGTGGNNIALQLVMDGLKLQGCEPTFLEARDAILQADLLNNGGANQCLLWQAFAKRGMGTDADDTGNPRRTQATDGFLVPAECVPVCGNGVIESGEQCDDGGTQSGDCCSSTCQFESNLTECRSAAGSCDIAEFCTGSVGTCPIDGFQPITTECRASAGVCDAADFCDGVSAQCTADVKLTGECRAVADACDLAETCDGAGDDCPADAFAPSTIPCRAPAGVCDMTDFCDGVSAACTADVKLTSECRPSAGICDTTENCDGAGNDCPTDVFASASTECRVAVGICDANESCTGSDPDCPSDTVLDGVPCLDADVCNGGEVCVMGSCLSGTALDCDDLDQCTADSCDEVTGCAHALIEPCAGVEVPSTSTWGQAFLIALLVAAGSLLVAQRMRATH